MSAEKKSKQTLKICHWIWHLAPCRNHMIHTFDKTYPNFAHPNLILHNLSHANLQRYQCLHKFCQNTERQLLNTSHLEFDKFFPFLMTALILGINFHYYGPYINLWVSILEFDLVSGHIWRTKLLALFWTIVYGPGPRL